MKRTNQKKRKKHEPIIQSPLDGEIDHLRNMADLMMGEWTMNGTTIEEDLLLQQATLFMRLAANALRTYREKLRDVAK
jgi:hypothetical protein